MKLIDTDAIANMIYEELKKKVNDILKNKIANKIRDDLIKHAESEVYDAYDPDYYKRRWTLIAPESYNIEVKDLHISITPIAQFNRRYGGWNEGDELGGFMNFGRGWHGYVMGNGLNFPSGGPLNVPLPRPYLTHVAEEWNDLIEDELKQELGSYADFITAKVVLGED